MTRSIAIIAITLLWTSAAFAGTTCTTRKSGSQTITSCYTTGDKYSTTCRSYKSGSVTKTSCS